MLGKKDEILRKKGKILRKNLRNTIQVLLFILQETNFIRYFKKINQDLP